VWWLVYGAVGAVAGAAGLFALRGVKSDLWYVFLAVALLAAAFEVVRARRASLYDAALSRMGIPLLVVRGVAAFVVVSLCAFAAFAMLYAGLAAP